jgi:hypothetical protein
MSKLIGLDTIDQLTDRRLGTFDVACPECGPLKRAARNQRRAVLRVWRAELGFATYCCARCGETGYARDRNSAPPDPVRVAKARAEAAERARTLKAKRLSTALWLWSNRKPIIGSIAERYLRDVRGYGGPVPTTLGFLPERGAYPAAMIAAFGLAHEVEPGVIAIADSAITGLHLTRLKPDGSGKAEFEDPDENAKIMIGFSAGSPIVLAPPNELLGLGVTEGIEDGLSVHQSTTLGVWAAGCASRLPALAAAVPSYIDCTSVVSDDDNDGRRHATELARGLRARNLDIRLIIPNAARLAA